jgi:hypothetical protein
MRESSDNHIVIPANAGIQCQPYCHSRECGNPVPTILSFPRMSESSANHIVIPANAGIQRLEILWILGTLRAK